MSAAKSAERAGAPEKPGAFPLRRKFLAGLAGAAGGGCLMAVGAGLYARQNRALPALALRPPGALPEAQFLAACTRCGLCVRGCPYDTLKLAAPGDPVPTGTPYFTARGVPCEMCDDIPCVPPCPTGALDPALTDITRARMGLAVLIDHETCLNFLGLRCDVCYRVCPVIDKAITLDRQHNARSDRHAMLLPTVHSDYCTGCGKCEAACVLEEAAIRILPFPLARGKLGGHYRKGWEEREKHGGSLIGEQVELPVRGLENRPYGDASRIPDEAPAPAGGDPPPGSSGLDSRWKP
ncbi:MAG: ferredoxin-type protein NapG [Candidatus Accumulibacter sp.]|jgi:ferredoxin-type protein NapG|nr:ferredoxin-type protein NapG [Accumulibacter sp.]